MKKNETIAIVGFGHLGNTLSGGYANAGYEVLVNNGTKKRTQQKLKEAGVKNLQVSTLEEIADQCSTVILCIKHGQLAAVGAELNHLLNKDHLVLSCLAQATVAEVQACLSDSDASVVKMMTTLGVGQRKGVSAYQLGNTDAKVESRVIRLIKKVSAKNCVMKLETEEDMKLFTKLVGCFPGVMAHFLHQLELSADKHGGQTFRQYNQILSTLLRSTADLIDLAGSAEELERQVATPGGYTIKTIDFLDTNGFSETLDQAIMSGL